MSNDTQTSGPPGRWWHHEDRGSAPLALTDFLLARIAKEEEQIAVDYESHLVEQRHVDHVLAECEAKRRIVEQYEAAVVAASEETDTESGWIKDGVEAALATTLSALALPYADHPDYREEWKP